MKTHIEFFDGKKMPLVGFGMWQADKPEVLEAALDKALEVGYRHFDTAFGYGNEDVFGRVLKRWFSTGKVKREDLFIVTKLPIQGTHADRVEKYLNLSLERLQLDYVDLYLVHCPACVKVGADGISPAWDEQGNGVIDLTSNLELTWGAMEAMVKAGKAKSIGVSNFSVSQVERILKVAKIQPANIQVELNVYYPKKQLRELCAKHKITVVAFAPLGSPGRKEGYKNDKGSHLKVKVPELLTEPVVLEISKKYNKTPAQVLLRFLAQQDIAVIPKSVTPARIAENWNITDFELDGDSMTKLDKLDTGKSGTWGFDWNNYLPGVDKHPDFELEF
jgi:aldehyde reductase